MALERSDRAIVLAVAVLSMAMTAAPFLWTGQLYHDTLTHYEYYRQNFDALYRFGEPAWWSPQMDFGFPTYFYALLGVVNAGKPAFVLVGSFVWLLGRLGIEIASMQTYYVLYFAVLVPALFLIGVWLVARQVFHSRATFVYVVTTAAFSPGVIMNLSDPGILEYTAYCLYFAAAWLHFVGQPSSKSFAVVCLAGGLVSLAPGQSALITAIPWLPLLVGVSLACSRAARAALRGVTLWQWTAAAALAIVTASPSLIAYAAQSDELTQYTLDGFDYSYEQLNPGNPLEFLLISVPGIGFEWDRYHPPPDQPLPVFGIHALSPGKHGAFDYMGAMALPLAVLGLLYGSRRIRIPIFVMLVLAATVLALAGHSPLFSLLLAFPSPLRSMNHYGDLLFRGGGFLLLLFAAGLGLDAATSCRGALRRLPALFAASTAATLLVWLRIGAPPQSLVGATIALIASYAVVLAWAVAPPQLRRARWLARGFIGLALIDVSTMSYWHLRLVMIDSETRAALESLGPLPPELDPTTQHTVIMRDAKRLSELAIQLLPALDAFCRAHPYEDFPTQADVSRAVEGLKGDRSLALPVRLADEPTLRRFLDAPAGVSCSVRLEFAGDYGAKHVSVTAAQPSLVFLRDIYSRHWHATLGDSPAPIHRAFGAFQAVVVPAGRSELWIRFAPPYIGWALIAAYAALLALAAAVLRWPAVPRRGTRALPRGRDASYAAGEAMP